MERKNFPYFQPIVSVYDGLIFGYESLARTEENGQVKSLGTFFFDESVPMKEKIETDRIVRRSALEYFGKTGTDTRLFININPSWLMSFKDKMDTLPTVEFMRSVDVDGASVVIEITEQEFHADMDVLNRMINQYREVGCQIAVDDFYFDTFDRLIHLKPDFVKIDMRLLKKSTQITEYSQLLSYIARFSVDLGISVIYEGIETEQELRNAIENGGSYLQGFLFSEAKMNFQAPDAYTSLVNKNLAQVIGQKIKSANNILLIESELNKILPNLITKRELKDGQSIDSLIRSFLPQLPSQCHRVFICDENGEQLSANFTRDLKGIFQFQPEYRNMNWGWRPYFVYNLVRIRHHSQGSISSSYIDRESRRKMRTFSYPLNGDKYLFLDFLDEF